jgi:hypothetical protein
MHNAVLHDLLGECGMRDTGEKKMFTEFLSGNQKASDHFVDLYVNRRKILNGSYRRNKVRCAWM